MTKPRTFQELATKAHDMEVIIANRHDDFFSIAESRKGKAKFRKNVKFSKS